jgi:membrane-bound lytic murein transglycosylase D
MKKFAGVLHFTLGAVFAFLIVAQFAFRTTDPSAKDPSTPSKPVYQWHAPDIPDQLSFAGEKVPLERWEVKERFDREYLFNFYNQANVIFLMKLSNRYFPIISERLKANGVPDDFKYLCVAESNLLGGAVSRAGAVGFWQFMNSTAPGYGLQTGSQVDERHDIIKSTDAACKYLKQAYLKFGNWTAAAASYNCGQGGYNGQATFQGTNNYYDLLLPEETNRYIFRILAFKHIMENAEKLGFVLTGEDKYAEVPYRTVTVTSSISNLAEFARNNGTTFKILRLMNPQLRGRSLSVPKGGSFVIKLPAE